MGSRVEKAAYGLRVSLSVHLWSRARSTRERGAGDETDEIDKLAKLVDAAFNNSRPPHCIKILAPVSGVSRYGRCRYSCKVQCQMNGTVCLPSYETCFASFVWRVCSHLGHLHRVCNGIHLLRWARTDGQYRALQGTIEFHSESTHSRSLVSLLPEADCGTADWRPTVARAPRPRPRE